MFKILVKINILFFFLVYFLLFGCCAPSRLEIVSVILCDHFNRVGECLEPVEKNHHYKIEIPNHKKRILGKSFLIIFTFMREKLLVF